MTTKRRRAGLALAAITATIPAMSAVTPVAATSARAHDEAASARLSLPSHYTHRAVHRLAQAEVVVSGLDNPRQLAWDRQGRLLVAEAGHGSMGKPGTCFQGPEGELCVGPSGKITRVRHPATATNGKPNRIAKGFLSGASPDGTFAVGSNGVSQGPSGPTNVLVSHFPPRVLRSAELSAHQNGRLLTLDKSRVANISGYEFRHNPDGEIVDTDPYAVLALHRHKLVADAAGDDILRYHKGRLSVWALLPGDTKKVDPVPTSFARGRNGTIYVGTLYSLVPHKARLLHYSARGKLLGSRNGLTSITGVAAGPRGHVFVSQLFAGCPEGSDPNCIPGRVTDIAPDGTRSSIPVPFPAGLAWSRGHLYVSAWSIAPSSGAFGNPEFSGQVWRLR